MIAIPQGIGKHGILVYGLSGMTPTILRPGPYRVYFYSHEPNEPPHVHVDRDDQSAKFWLDPVVFAINLGFSPKELNRVLRLLQEHEGELMEAWNAYHGT